MLVSSAAVPGELTGTMRDTQLGRLLLRDRIERACRGLALLGAKESSRHA